MVIKRKAMYAVGSKSFRPHQLFKVTEIKKIAIFQHSLPLFQHTFHICELVTHRWHYISLTAFSIWPGFCMSGRKLLDPVIDSPTKLNHSNMYINQQDAQNSCD